jgi:hypothetical protein
MFDPADRFRTDPFARHHAAMRIDEERAARAQTEGRASAQRQQRIQKAATKRATLAHPDPGYKPSFPEGFFG